MATPTTSAAVPAGEMETATSIASLLLEGSTDPNDLETRKEAMLSHLMSALETKTDGEQKEAKEEKKEQRCAHSECHSEGSHEKPLQRCSGCDQVLYCSQDCQRKDWRLRHKEACRSVKINKALSQEYNSSIAFILEYGKFLGEAYMYAVRKHARGRNTGLLVQLIVPPDYKYLPPEPHMVHTLPGGTGYLYCSWYQRSKPTVVGEEQDLKAIASASEDDVILVIMPRPTSVITVPIFARRTFSRLAALAVKYSSKGRRRRKECEAESQKAYSLLWKETIRPFAQRYVQPT